MSGPGADPLEQLIAGDDLEGLLGRVDDLCQAGAWPDLEHLRRRCRAAFADYGRQLWPAAVHAEYRLALEAPGPWAAAVLVPEAGRSALGPLPEVAASTHTWDELAPHLPGGPDAAVFASERVVRGEDLSGRDDVPDDDGGLPPALQTWEPAYPLASYEPYKASFADVTPPPLVGAAVTAPGAERHADPLVEDALVDLASVWATESGGTVRVASVRGAALEAVGALVAATGDGPPQVRAASVDPGRALALMAWVAASGGARGRRRGAAYGRFAAWWAVAAMAGLDPAHWPHPPDAVGAAAAELSWVWWARPEWVGGGWSLGLAAASPQSGRAWAVEARDTA